MAREEIACICRSQPCWRIAPSAVGASPARESLMLVKEAALPALLTLRSFLPVKPALRNSSLYDSDILELIRLNTQEKSISMGSQCRKGSFPKASPAGLAPTECSKFQAETLLKPLACKNKKPYLSSACHVYVIFKLK